MLDRCGRTYAAQAGIRLRNTPGPLYQVLVLAQLLSAPVGADVAVAAARAVFAAGLRTPRRMLDATWQRRVDALDEGGYRRYDERAATLLAQAAAWLLDRHGGDLRRLRGRRHVEAALRECPGIGPTGAHIVLRELQAVWPEYAPHVDDKVRAGAGRLGLPGRPAALTRLVGREEVPRLTAGLVRVALDERLAEEVRAQARR